MGVSIRSGTIGRTGLLLGLVWTCLAGAALPASAQQQPFHEFSACNGSISSLAPGVIPADGVYTVDILDPTDAALEFRAIFLAELKAAAKPTRDDGNLVFSFRAESIFSGITARARVEPSYRGEESRSGSSARSDEDETRALIHSDRPGRRDTGTASQRILVEAELRDTRTQRVVWLATVHCDPITSDDTLLMKFVAQVIVANVGQALRQKPF